MEGSSYSSSPFHRCFQKWINQQEKDLTELNQAAKDHRRNDEKLKAIAEKTLKQLQHYHEERLVLVQEDPFSSFSPTWTTPLENSFQWVAGCRPSLTIQLVYTLCGAELEAHLEEFLQGVRRGNLGELSPVQLGLVNELHCKTVEEEEMISNRLGTYQEDIACLMDAGRNGFETDGMVVNIASMELASILEEADKLRLKTVEEVIHILTPLQGVDFLVAAKKFDLAIHEWGSNRKR